MKQLLTTVWMLVIATGCLYATALHTANERDTTRKDLVKVSLQGRQVYSFDNGVHFSGNFAGARLGTPLRVNDSVFQVSITPENEPINKSPWYAFKLWSHYRKDVYVTLHYTYGTHRYHPKLSTDGKRWKDLEKSNVNTHNEDVTLHLNMGADTVWVAAQELIPSSEALYWVDSLAGKFPSLKKQVIGYSLLDRPVVSFRIGNKKNANTLVVLSRQHPPEVTGYQAMQAFTERILAKNKLSSRFKKKFDVVVIPSINPDGVDLGHWRHNAGGVDLNRDWDKFLQPETRAVSSYLKELASKGDSLRFCLDFHSTQEDVFYIVTEEKQSITQRWLAAIQQAIPDYKVNQSFHGIGSATSKNWIYKQFGAEAVTYEVGDDTDRLLLKRIGETAADELMKILLENLRKKK